MVEPKPKENKNVKCMTTKYIEGTFGICDCSLHLGHEGKHECYKCGEKW